MYNVRLTKITDDDDEGAEFGNDINYLDTHMYVMKQNVGNLLHKCITDILLHKPITDILLHKILHYYIK